SAWAPPPRAPPAAPRWGPAAAPGASPCRSSRAIGLNGPVIEPFQNAVALRRVAGPVVAGGGEHLERGGVILLRRFHERPRRPGRVAVEGVVAAEHAQGLPPRRTAVGRQRLFEQLPRGRLVALAGPHAPEVPVLPPRPQPRAHLLRHRLGLLPVPQRFEAVLVTLHGTGQAPVGHLLGVGQRPLRIAPLQ